MDLIPFDFYILFRLDKNFSAFEMKAFFHQGSYPPGCCLAKALHGLVNIFYLLHHFPETPERPLREEYATFPWKREAALQEAWRRGRTGYPIVDAGMRQLWRTGWMHNRVRMIAASFFVKQLLQPWTDGAAWFWDTLVDADLANNTLGWQWSAGCGADAAPYFRIFNPVLQGERFDPDGWYAKNREELVSATARLDQDPALLSQFGEAVARLRSSLGRAAP